MFPVHLFLHKYARISIPSAISFWPASPFLLRGRNRNNLLNKQTNVLVSAYSSLSKFMQPWNSVWAWRKFDLQIGLNDLIVVGTWFWLSLGSCGQEQGHCKQHYHRFACTACRWSYECPETSPSNIVFRPLYVRLSLLPSWILYKYRLFLIVISCNYLVQLIHFTLVVIYVFYHYVFML